MTIKNDREIIEEIIRLKRERGAVILSHNYQRPEIQELADFVGDSLDLSIKAKGVESDFIVFCGVRFMAETAKILSPHKRVFLPVKGAGCPMADMVDVEGLFKLKERYPSSKVLAYVNTNADVKTLSDICCTSSNALKVVQNIEGNDVIFVPDRNLSNYCQRFTDKRLLPWDGFCYVHRKIKRDEVLRIKDSMPHALLLVHPECEPDVIDVADKVLSTQGMVRFVKESSNETFIIGTEEGLIHRLKRENPGKRFLSPGRALVCVDMKKTKLVHVLNSLKNLEHEILLDDETVMKARAPLERMIRIV